MSARDGWAAWRERQVTPASRVRAFIGQILTSCLVARVQQGSGVAVHVRSELPLPHALGRVCASSAAATPVAKEMRVRCGFHDHGGLVSAFRPLPLPARAATADPDALPAAPDCN